MPGAFQDWGNAKPREKNEQQDFKSRVVLTEFQHNMFLCQTPPNAPPSASFQPSFDWKGSSCRGCLWMRIKVHVRHQSSLVSAISHEVAEVFESNLAFYARFEGLVSARTKLFDRACQADAEVVGRIPEHFAHRAGYTRTVCVHVVYGLQLGRELC